MYNFETTKAEIDEIYQKQRADLERVKAELERHDAIEQVRADAAIKASEERIATQAKAHAKILQQIAQANEERRKTEAEARDKRIAAEAKETQAKFAAEEKATAGRHATEIIELKEKQVKLVAEVEAKYKAQRDKLFNDIDKTATTKRSIPTYTRMNTITMVLIGTAITAVVVVLTTIALNILVPTPVLSLGSYLLSLAAIKVVTGTAMIVGTVAYGVVAAAITCSTLAVTCMLYKSHIYPQPNDQDQNQQSFLVLPR